MRFIPILAAILCAASLTAGAQTLGGRGLLGVFTSNVPPNIGVNGAWVRQVAPGSAASTAGVQPNDVIIAIDGRPVPGAEALTTYVTGRGPGETVTLQILRPSASGVRQLTLTVTLGGTPAAQPSQQLTERQGNPPQAVSEAPPPAASVTGLDAVSWTSFVDPNEQAFSAEVPQGWRAVGGLVRHTAVDPSIFLRILSPDRRTYLLIGDLAVTLFTTPTRTMFGQPTREAGAVQRYLPGTAFAQAYVGRAIPMLCSNVIITGQHERPDLAQGPWARFNPQAHHEGGDVTFTCNHGREQARGIIAAATYLLSRGSSTVRPSEDGSNERTVGRSAEPSSGAAPFPVAPSSMPSLPRWASSRSSATCS